MNCYFLVSKLNLANSTRYSSDGHYGHGSTLSQRLSRRAVSAIPRHWTCGCDDVVRICISCIGITPFNAGSGDTSAELQIVQLSLCVHFLSISAEKLAEHPTWHSVIGSRNFERRICYVISTSSRTWLSCESWMKQLAVSTFVKLCQSKQMVQQRPTGCMPSATPQLLVCFGRDFTIATWWTSCLVTRLSCEY